MTVKSLSMALLCATVLLALQDGMAQNVSTLAYESDSGFGEISYEPGTNVSQFAIYSTNEPYAYSSNTTLSTAVSGDGTPVFSNSYSATYFAWTNGDTTPAGGGSGQTMEQSVEALTNTPGYPGVTPWTTASISLTAPSTNFTVDLVVHDYYANASLGVTVDGQTIGTYTNIMSLASNPTNRSTDFLYTETFSGMTTNDTVGLELYDLQNLGSAYANIDLFSSAVDFDVTTEQFGDPTMLDNLVPEPSICTLLGLSALAFLIGCRRISVISGRLTLRPRYFLAAWVAETVGSSTPTIRIIAR